MLGGLLAGLRRPPKKIVLDLGPASGENVQQLAGCGCKLFIADYFTGLAEAGASARKNPRAFASACRRLLSYAPDLSFDVILMWDLLNYLSLEEVEVLMEHLGRHSRPGTRVMAMVSIHQQIPARPFRFVILNEEQIRYEAVSAGLRDCPRHRENDLLRCMEGFQVERAMLLRNGMQEYSFVFAQSEDGPSPSA